MQTLGTLVGIAASSLLTTLAFGSGTTRNSLDELGLNLPSNVRVEAINYSAGLSRPPFSHSVVEIGPDWVKSEFWMDQAGFGPQIFGVTLDDAQTSFRYTVAERRGMTARRVPAYRPSRDEALATPIGYWRALRGMAADGHRLTISSDGPVTTIEVDGSPINLGAMRFELSKNDPAELRAIDIRSGLKVMRFEYSDWREVAGGRHPYRIDLHAYELSRQDAEGSDPNPAVIIVSDVRPLTDLSLPARWPLPETAIITDLDTGISTDPSGRVVNADQPAATQLTGFSSTTVSTRWPAAAVGTGVVLLGGAGLIVLRRAAARG